MAGWKAQRPSRTSRWQAPGIFFNFEFGVTFSSDDRTHTKGIQYMSRRMEERLHEERMLRNREAAYYCSFQEPSDLQQLATLGALMPGSQESGVGLDYYQRQRQRQMGIRTREQHERGTSAHPSFEGRMNSPPVNYIPHIAPIQHTPSIPLERMDSYNPLLERTDRPLPPTPSHFRLGEDEMPWSMPAFYRSPDTPRSALPFDTGSIQDNGSFIWPPEQSNTTTPFNESTRGADDQMDDPQRAREMETLHQAMMTVDSLPIGRNDFDQWTWDNMEEMSRNPRSIGWAVASPPVETPPRFAPMPYVVSQWERSY